MSLTFVHRDQDIRIRTECYCRDIFTVLKRKRSRLVTIAHGWSYTQDMRDYYSLYKVEHRNAVSHRAQDRISIRRENDVPLSIDSATKVRELRNHVHFLRGQESRSCITLKLAFITVRSGKNSIRGWAGGTWTDQNAPPRPEPSSQAVGLRRSFYYPPNNVRYCR